MSEKSRKPFLREHIKKEIAGLLWMAAGLFLLLSLVSFNNGDPSFNNNLNPSSTYNFCGKVGAYVADLFYQVIGLPAMMIPFACLLFAWRLLKFRDLHPRFYKIIAFLVMLVSIAGLISLKFGKVALFGQILNQAGGFIGYFLASTLKSWFNLTGAAIFLLVFLSVSAMLVARFSMVLFLEGLLSRLGGSLERKREARQARRALQQVKSPKKEKGPVIRAPEPPALQAGKHRVEHFSRLLGSAGQSVGMAQPAHDLGKSVRESRSLFVDLYRLFELFELDVCHAEPVVERRERWFLLNGPL